jgi:NADH-ubiquinone oxidoreductase chain 2
LFSSLGASFLISAADIVSMYLSIELQSFGVYILPTIFRDSDDATSAGLKYFLLGAQCTRETLLKSPIKLSNSGEALKLLVLIKNYIQFIYTIIN